jgi:putative ABC transport system permease protein
LHSFGGGREHYFSYGMYRDLRDRNTVLSGVAGEDEATVGVLVPSAGGGMSAGSAEPVDADLVTGSYFGVLGVRAAVGRVLEAGDETEPGANSVAVLGWDYWQKRWGGDPGVVGRTVEIDGRPIEVVGVAERGFASAIADFHPQLYLPVTMRGLLKSGHGEGDDFTNRRSSWMPLVARLKPGVTREAAEVALQPLWHSLRADELAAMPHPSAGLRKRFLDQSRLLLEEDRTGFSPTREDGAAPLLVALGMVAVLLGMVTANVAGLTLVRAAGRGREMAVRAALGASRARTVRGLLVEGLLLGLAGAGLGLAVAPAATGVLLRRLLEDDGTGVFHTSPGWGVAGAVVALAVGVSLLFSLLPAWGVVRRAGADLEVLRGARVAGGRGVALRVAVAAQMLLSVVLLCGAGLMIRTLANLKSQPLGLRVDHVMTFRVDPGLAGYRGEEAAAVHRRVLEALGGAAGVEAAGGTTDADLGDSDQTGDVSVEGHRDVEGHAVEVEQPEVTPGYFAALRVPLLAGRVFRQGDVTADGAAPQVAVVNERFARLFFGSAAGALGHWVNTGDATTGEKRPIVGVVADSKHKLRAEVLPTVFAPFGGGQRLTFYVRTRMSPETAEGAVRGVVRAVDPKLVMTGLRTMDEQVEQALGTERTLEMLGSWFGAAALLMTGIGLYGVLAYATAQRTREIGIRMALGAVRGEVVRVVVADVAVLAGVAAVAALPAVWGLERVLGSQLYGVGGLEPGVLLGCVGLLLAMVAVAGALPAWRAATVDPVEALRAD